jgi:transposase
VIELGPQVRACLEMMSGAVWVRDRLAGAGWRVEVADARKVKNVAALACKTDKVDARVLAELCRRQLVPALWIPSVEERAMGERLKRRLHLVRLGTSAKNRVFGLLTQWGLRIACDRLRRPDAMELLETRGVPEVWRRSVAEALAVIELLDERIAPLDRELGPLARADRRVSLLSTIPGIGPVLGLTIAAEIGDVARFQSPRKLIGYSGLGPRVKQSGERSRSGELSKASSRTLRFAAVEAARAPGARRTLGTASTRTSRRGPARRTRPSRRSPARFSSPAGTCSAAKSPSSRATPKPILSRQAPSAFWPPDGPHAKLRSRDSFHPRWCAASAEREMSVPPRKTKGVDRP